MNPNDLVVLIPGLFGFDTLGEPPLQVAYFDDVRQMLSKSTGLAADRIVVCPSPPADTLKVRVALLHRFVADHEADDPLLADASARIHLIGHSTGGCDARLLVNLLFTWPKAPTKKERNRLIDRIGAIITLSAPLQGTPIARRLTGTLDAAIPLLFLLSIIGKAGVDLQRPWRFLMTGMRSMLPQTAGPASAKARMRELVIEAGLPQAMSGRVLAYLDSIVDKHELIKDLTVQAFSRLNPQILLGDRRQLRSYVSVSPPPRLHLVPLPAFPLKLLQAAVYAYSYLNTRPSVRLHEHMKFPEGAWLDTADHASLADDDASDGVVPAGSQTLDGQAAGIVFGDHLDVVGHYNSAGLGAGDTVFRSNAGFDDARFELLWATIANDIRTAPSVI